ncbi:MAG: c-type cytochrome [Bacteroidetes bacterium]|nr:c-type cytochrome [Bacteroidota bacterium]
MKSNINRLIILFLLGMFFFFTRCEMDPEIIDEPQALVYDPTPYEVSAVYGIPPFPLLNQNPLTIKGVALGRRLFYDPILSADSTLSCSGCHSLTHAFSDSTQFSIGIDGFPGKRNTMPIFNLGYSPYDIGFFWDGRATTLEDQVLMPIQDPLEMHEIMPNVITKLSRSEYYPDLFYEAFGIHEITVENVANALAQFTKSIVSGNSRFDSAMNFPGVYLEPEEVEGSILFDALDGGDCLHCHGINGGLFTDYQYRNNGLDPVFRFVDFVDPGLGAITGDTLDYGKFKTPSLRNIALTAPYMHDGRFATLEEVLDFYSEGVNATPFTDNFMQYAFQGGVQLTADEKAKIIAFLKSLTDEGFKNNTEYQNPFEE